MTDPSSIPALPPFYIQPTPLDSTRHQDWRLLPGDATFAAATPSVTLSVSEFAAASRCYPILFTAGEPSPLALMGLDQSNLFIKDGRWAQGAYVPAYVRRFPFVLIESADRRGFVLGVDGASPRIAKDGDEGAALFEDGQPTEITRQALEFCRLFNLDHQRTQAFCAALKAADLLVERQADATLPDGRKLGVTGFQVVDPERFAALPEDKVLTWHRNGWLALAYHHLASLEGFQALLLRQGQRSPQEVSSIAAMMSDPLSDSE